MGMTAKQWELVKDLYQTALECSRRSGPLFSNKTSATNGPRRSARLLAHNRLGSFLSSPHLLTLGAGAIPRTTDTGEVLAGRFRIVNSPLRRYGEVYKAEDLLLDRMLR